jgi:rod shape determining protein RodA
MGFFRRLFAGLNRFDWVLLAATLLLVLFGIAAIYSLTINSDTPSFAKFSRQLIALTIGLILMVSVSAIEPRFLRGYAGVFFLGALVLLVLVLIFGTTIRGTRGWFVLAGVSFQPVELVKISLVLLLARLFTHEFGRPGSMTILVRSIIVAGVTVGLVFIQPDVGSGLVLLSVWLGLLLLVHRQPRHLLFLAGGLVVAVLFAWFVLFGPVQQARILTFLDPNSDPLNRGYQATQSIIAVGSGHIFGRGLGLGSQSQLNFLPDPETDFIFAVIAEELGFIGSLLILGLFVFFFSRLLGLLRRVRDPYNFLVIAGFLILFAVQSAVNIAMNIGLVPITGIPLPLVSYGGSSLIASLIGVGIIEGIARREQY